jgi:cytidylate kinase
MKPLLFEQCRTYLLAHALSPQQEHDAPPLRAVTISRETGAGAITVGRLLMEYLESKQGGDERYPWAVFDRDLVKRVLKDHRLPGALENSMPEDSKRRADEIVEELLGLRPSTWALVQHTNHTILRLARAGNVILVGRGAHLVTSELKHVIHVRLVAPFRFRVEHVKRYYHMWPEEAAEFVRKEDRARNRYVRRHFKSDARDPHHYHLTINTGLVGFPAAARLIGDTVLGIPFRPMASCFMEDQLSLAET